MQTVSVAGFAGASHNETHHKPLTSIRGVAALWVMASHLSGPLQSYLPAWLYRYLSVGYMGVDIFFVLSGCILGLVYRDLSLSGTPRFFFKRALRVYPLNIFLTTVMVAFAALGVPPGLFQQWPTLPWFYAMMEAFMPHPAIAWILTTWSVGIELVCYLGFPLLVLLLRRLPRLLLPAALLAALVIEFWVQKHYLASFASWHALWRGAGGFGLGVVLGILAPHLPRPRPWLASVGELAALAALGLSVAENALRWLPLAAAALILLLYFDAGVVARALRGRFWFWQGRISYSVYLLHGPLMADWLFYGARYGIVVGNPAALAKHMPPLLAAGVGCLVFATAVSALATVTWRWVEQPARRWRVPGSGRARGARALGATPARR